MPKKRCPACGSNHTLKIIYGEPTYEAFEAAEGGELVLGGCCVTSNDPTHFCKTCDQQFGVTDSMLQYDMGATLTHPTGTNC
ncbi:hypothetical protein [Desulfitobacterium sp.]|uniref:hypothetical protein n=1 Tax=Desulfitobacterium sp. TaxID=49981 RepID=UPI002BE4F082|nr:hypothetical protein [Desulfitobacterium sp.]HVJ47648.1 hypothetical protein [Desulfitobacterium sp.]